MSLLNRQFHFDNYLQGLRPAICLFLSFTLFYAFNFGFIVPAQAELIGTYSGDEAGSQLESVPLIAPISFANSTTLLPGLQNMSINPYIASGEFLTSNEVIAWNAANVTMALVMAHIFNQQGQGLMGIGLASGMIIIVPILSWLLLFGSFYVGFACGGGFAAADCTIPNIIAGMLATGAFLLPLAAVFLGLSWLPSQNQITSGTAAMTEPALKMQLLSF